MKKSNKRMIIFTDNINEFMSAEDIKNDYEECTGESADNASEEELYNHAYRLLEFECEDLREALACYDRAHNKRVLALASLGLWYGRCKGGKIINSLSALFDACEDYNTLFYERKNGTLQLEASHHDGVNYFEFYEITDKGERFIETHEYMEREQLHNELRKYGRTKNIHFEIIL